MSTPNAMLPSATSADHQDRHASHAWRMRMLEFAAERGVELLDVVCDQAREGTCEDDLGLSYSRIARAIRQSVILHAKLEEEWPQERRAEGHRGGPVRDTG